jgi:hypothetical protein
MEQTRDSTKTHYSTQPCSKATKRAVANHEATQRSKMARSKAW